ncbi:MAG: patatin-like phospholipase family protein [Rhodococcus sp. (in: high G+C Gram-positive bacteria)]|uniref:patatin-like phospholipase family protein n=1 Tax=Rhodococcus sp. TaxID=1831 RepID=UPI003BB1C298
MTAAEPKQADLVLAGGGVKGIGLVGAVAALLDDGYSVERVSGTSAGSVVGSVVAAGSTKLTAEEVRDLVLSLEYDRFRDPGPIESIPVLGTSWALLRGTGLFRGDYAHDWVRSQLANLGVRTFGDLRIGDPDLREERRYKLVVTVTDVTTGQLVRLPWDYRRVYGLDPDEQPVADAVRASMSIPFYFRPVELTSTAGVTSTLVDGGLLSNFPIDSLDRTDGKPPRRPTFGITMLPNLPAGNDRVIPQLAPLRVLGAPHLLERVITTVLVGRDQAYLNQPWVNARTIRVDSTEVGVLDFDITREETDALYAKGYAAAEEFLSTWDWPAYRARFRS